ncbi:glycosyltransferase [Providencia rettgeri]|uniref:glycosyltransferase n=1 Tax=Providencia rettgeri TaxID=587 RepID=UPI00065E8023|nr:glycosyltransferase [Providencia rettgeri]
MTFIFNCTTNVVGGAVQNSVNFIKNIFDNKHEKNWFFLLSDAVYNQISHLLIEGNFKVFKSPAKSIRSRILIKSYVKNLNPYFVYTNAGPAYVKFECLHVMGCSNPYVLGDFNIVNKHNTSILKKIIRNMHTIYQRAYIKKANYWILQTEQSKTDFIKLGIIPEKIFVVYNSISEKFLKYYESIDTLRITDTSLIKKSNEIKILYPSAYYPHKNFEIIPSIAYNLKVKGYNVKFILTISHSENLIKLLLEAKKLGVDACICNYGPFSHHEALSLYLIADIIFQPSLLEIFSTSYVEAMAVNKPLIAADLPFSRDICKNYAFYFKPGDVTSATNTIIEVIDNYRATEQKIMHSSVLLSKYGDQSQRFDKIYNILMKIKGN